MFSEINLCQSHKFGCKINLYKYLSLRDKNCRYHPVWFATGTPSAVARLAYHSEPQLQLKSYHASKQKGSVSITNIATAHTCSAVTRSRLPLGILADFATQHAYRLSTSDHSGLLVDCVTEDISRQHAVASFKKHNMFSACAVAQKLLFCEESC